MGTIKTTIDELGNKVTESLTSMLYYSNPVSLIVGTTAIEPMYLGVTAVDSTNLSMNFSMYCSSSVVCTLTIQIQLDNKDISFTPKQKLQQGDNIIGIPLGIPQVSSGPHYIGVFLKVDTGALSIPMFNLQCMVDGRNLQGGLSAEPAHAECFQKLEYINMNNLCMDKIKCNYISSQLESSSIFTLINHQIADITSITDGKQICTNYTISIN